MILSIIFTLPLLIVVNGQSNCSLYGFCDPHGYCVDSPDEEWSCECKFWWEGEVCNRQSGNGIQVIVLGCLVGILLFTFYGLRIGRSIYKKMKNRTEPEIKDPSQTPKFVHIAIDHVKKSTPLESCLIGIFTIIVAGTTLVAKWSLLRNVHKEIVDQYAVDKNASFYYNRSSVCDILDQRGFSTLILPIAAFSSIICIIVTKRISCMKDKCHGYGAPAIPFDFLSHKDRKLAAVIFAIIADELYRLLQDAIGGSSGPSLGAIVGYLFRIAQVSAMGLKFYPILAAIHINSILILICATLYTWFIYALTIVTRGMCSPDYYPTYDDYLDNSTDINDKLNYYGTGPSLVAIQLCSDIPKYLCFAYISMKLPAMIIANILKQRKPSLSEETILSKSLTREENLLIQISHHDSIEMRYVRNLFLPFDQRPRSNALVARLIPKFIYEWRDDFRFSSRVLCIYSSLFLILFIVTIDACMSIVPSLQSLRSDLQDALNGVIDAFINNDSEIEIPSNFPLPNLTRPFLLAVAMTTTIIVAQLLILLANIRRNLLQAFRGDDSEIPRRQRSDYVSYATGNFHFAGYFLGYLIWGFIIIATFSSIVCLCIDSFVVYGSVRILEKALKAIIPSLLIMVFKIYVNNFLAQYVFLQHYGDVLALNNRRVLTIFIYFNFFLDAFLGFISSIFRLVKSIIGGILYMCRIDYSPLGRKLESLDSGFKAYCGFIHTECTHRHPIMLVFVSHLFCEMKKQQHYLHTISENSSNDLGIKEKEFIQQKRSLRYIKKWRLAAFLVRNPVVVFFRKTFLKQLPLANRRAINDIDSNNENNIHRTIALYTRQMAAARSDFIAEIDPTQIIVQRF